MIFLPIHNLFVFLVYFIGIFHVYSARAVCFSLVLGNLMWMVKINYLVHNQQKHLNYILGLYHFTFYVV